MIRGMSQPPIATRERLHGHGLKRTGYISACTGYDKKLETSLHARNVEMYAFCTSTEPANLFARGPHAYPYLSVPVLTQLVRLRVPADTAVRETGCASNIVMA